MNTVKKIIWGVVGGAVGIVALVYLYLLITAWV